MKKEKENYIDEKFVKSAAWRGDDKNLHFDREVSGFGLRVSKTGYKAFVFNYQINGRDRRYSIGPYPAHSASSARKRAIELKRMVTLGQDPQAEKESVRKAPTLADLYEQYKEQHLPKRAKRDQNDIHAMWRDYILPAIGAKKLSDISSHDVDVLHNRISQVAKVRANRVLENLRSVLNKGIRWGMTDHNPALGFKRNPEQPREIFLTESQLADVVKKLDEMPYHNAAMALKMIIFTGARLNEVLKTEWPHLDLERRVWFKPHTNTKQKKVHRVPLSDELVELLKKHKTNAAGQYVFPGMKEDTHLRDIKRPWAWLKKNAKLPPGFRTHDFRHTYASILVSSGSPLYLVGNLLGHSQQQTTARYAHLFDEPLRKQTNIFSKIARNGASEVETDSKYVCAGQ